MDINSKNDFGENVLFPVALNGNLKLLKYLVENGADINATNNQKFTIIFPATSSGNVELLDFLVQKGLSVNETVLGGITPIFNATASGQADALKFLLKKGANINQKTNNNMTPLFNVAIKIQEKDTIIKSWSTYPYMADLSEKERKNIENLIACWKVLIDAKIDPDALDNTNKKAIDHLVGNQNYYNILAKYAQVEKKVAIQPKTTNEDIKNKINSLIAKEDFEAIKLLTEQNPNYVNYIVNDELRLMLTGPKGMKVGDIKKLLKNGKSETIVISLIKRVQIPYKEFTIEEIDLLSKMGLSDKIISSMIDVTTELSKDDKKRKEQEAYLNEHKKISEQKNETKVIYQNNNTSNEPNPSNPVTETIQNEAVKHIGKMIFDKLF